MPKRRDAAPRPGQARVSLSDAEIDGVLDALDDALARGDHERVNTFVEQLWRARRRMPELLTRRLLAGRARVPAFAFQLLAGFAGPQAEEYFERIAGDRAVADIVRFGAQRRAGWPEQGERKRRLAFLDTFHDADATLVEAICQGTDTWPPESEILEEVLGYLALLPAERVEGVITRTLASERAGPGAAWLLQALLHVDAPATAQIVLRELVRQRPPGAAGAVLRLAKTARRAALRKEAMTAAQRLQLQVVERTPAAIGPLPPVERVLLSLIDGSGGQVIVVVRKWGEGAFLVADILHKDDWGIKGGFGSSHATPDQVEEIITGLEDAGIALIEVDLAAVRGALAGAVEVNAATRHTIPPIFELWEPLVHEGYPPPPEEPVTLPELDDAPYAGRRDLTGRSGELIEHEFFASWGFDEARTLAAMADVPPPGRRGMADRQYRPMIAHLIDAPERARLRQRLRRQAWLLEQDGDDDARDLSLATAAQLVAATPDELGKQPFLRGLVERSVTMLVDEMLYEEGPFLPPLL